MKTTLKAALAGAAMLASVTSAHALSIVDAAGSCDLTDNIIGGAFLPIVSHCGVSSDRTDIDAVNLGAADGEFFSLGLIGGATLGGLAVFEISPAFTGPAMVVEVTNPSNHWEAADIYVGTDFDDLVDNFLTISSAGRVNNGKGGTETATNTVTITGVYNFILFEDASIAEYGSTGNGTEDGFDLDSFTVTPVPLPAGALLLGAALVGLGATRRRAL